MAKKHFKLPKGLAKNKSETPKFITMAFGNEPQGRCLTHIIGQDSPPDKCIELDSPETSDGHEPASQRQ